MSDKGKDNLTWYYFLSNAFLHDIEKNENPSTWKNLSVIYFIHIACLHSIVIYRHIYYHIAMISQKLRIHLFQFHHLVENRQLSYLPFVHKMINKMFSHLNAYQHHPCCFWNFRFGFLDFLFSKGISKELAWFLGNKRKKINEFYNLLLGRISFGIWHSKFSSTGLSI